MGFFKDFLSQKVPRSGKEIPAYYRRALSVSDGMLIVYFVLSFFLFPIINQHWEWVPAVMAAGTAGGLWMVRKHGARLNLVVYSILCLAWVGWSVYTFGWGGGTQHFLTLILVLVFFNVYEKPLYKVIWFLALLGIRVLLFSLSRNQWNPAVYSEMGETASTIYQTTNTVFFFLLLATLCVIFSTSVQDTERQLRLRNQTLYKEAGTDPLTGLPNRRAMIETIEKYQKSEPESTFCVAIADIDFFKKVNDTYGHNCGDYTLVKLTELFAEHAGGKYSVCRWGGEEFCFFMPGMNLDEAKIAMNDLCFAVERMKLSFEENDFSITITIGVEENDYSSPLEDLLAGADEKLYMGKEQGRNRVVV